jgi:hypothetical protein
MSMVAVYCTGCGAPVMDCECVGRIRPAQFPVPSVFGAFESNKGWICPVCGRGNAPTTPQCFCKPNPTKIEVQEGKP